MRVLNGLAPADAPVIRVTGTRALPGHPLGLRFATQDERIVDMTPLPGVPARLLPQGHRLATGRAFERYVAIRTARGCRPGPCPSKRKVQTRPNAK